MEEVAAVDAGVAGVCCRRSDGSKKAMDELVVKGIPAMGERFAVQPRTALVNQLHVVKYEASLLRWDLRRSRGRWR